MLFLVENLSPTPKEWVCIYMSESSVVSGVVSDPQIPSISEKMGFPCV